MSKRVIIVGGGTSGWMTASYLRKALGSSVRVTLVESSEIRTIGVGEATFSTLKLFFDFLGLHERDWMPHCSGTYKLAIRYQDWTKQKGQYFYHPFERLEMASGMNAAEWWLKLKQGEEPFDKACFTVPWLSDANRSPRFLDGTVYDDKVRGYYPTGMGTTAREPMDGMVPNVLLSEHKVQYPYAYHFNASELAAFLQKYAVALGAERIDDEVIEVPRTEDGSIAAIRTKEHGLIAGDLFVDCTGFRGLLINKTLGERFISFSENLPNDRAVAIQVPRDIAKLGIRPYTTAHAHSAGWSWNIPLYGRDGTGYVYSSAFLSEDEAEREFREFLGPAADGCPANHIKMRIGRNERSWVKNCVAIGLSSGFVEPLESTGIFFIQHGIEELVNHFPTGDIDPNMVASYNKNVGECIDGVREFLILHYYASDREDTPYWKATKHVRLPEPLRERLQIWKARLPGPRNIYQHFHGFESYSWLVILLGLGNRPATYLKALDGMDPAKGEAMFQDIKRRASKLVETLPTQYEYLTHVRQSS